MQGNSKTGIFIEGAKIHDIDTVGILDCKMSAYFWISWQYGILSVGTGSNPGSELLLTTKDPLPFDIEAIALDTDRQMGYWGFGQLQGKLTNFVFCHHVSNMIFSFSIVLIQVIIVAFFCFS